MKEIYKDYKVDENSSALYILYIHGRNRNISFTWTQILPPIWKSVGADLGQQISTRSPVLTEYRSMM